MQSDPPMALRCSNLVGPELILGTACYPRLDNSCKQLLAELSSIPVDGFCQDQRGVPLTVGKGHAAVVLVAWVNRLGPVAVKVRRRDSKTRSLEREAFYLKRAYHAGAGPEPYWWGREVIAMEYVHGTLLGKVSIGPREAVEALEAARALDAEGIVHRELARPWKHVILGPSKARIIDYDSARDGCGSVNRIVSALAIRATGEPPRGLLRSLLAEYKESCDRNIFEIMKEEVLKLYTSRHRLYSQP